MKDINEVIKRKTLEMNKVKYEIEMLNIVKGMLEDNDNVLQVDKELTQPNPNRKQFP